MQKKICFASIGDCCVDIYQATNETKLGGTAYNTAIHASQAGAETSIFSAIGTDSYGKQFLETCNKAGVKTDHLNVLDGQTSEIKIELDASGKPQYGEWQLGVIDNYRLSEDDKGGYLNNCDIVRMTLFQPLTDLFEQFIETEINGLKVADFAGDSQYSKGANIVEKYIPHLDVVIKSINTEDNDSLSFFQRISKDNPEKIILLLLGSSGSMVYQNGKEFRQPAIEVDVKDTTGAGDAYTATFLVNYAQYKDPSQALHAGANSAHRYLLNNLQQSAT